MKKYILITVFAMAGAILRYLTGLSLNTAFPLGTITVNAIGCFLLPIVFILMKEANRMKPDMIHALGTGFVGALTTFSTFSVDTIKLLEHGRLVLAALYLVASLMIGLFAAYVSVNLCTWLVDKYVKKEDKTC